MSVSNGEQALILNLELSCVSIMRQNADTFLKYMRNVYFLLLPHIIYLKVRFVAVLGFLLL